MYFYHHATTIGLVSFAGLITGWSMTQDLPLALISGVAAALSGAALARMFGAPGAIGWVIAALAALLATGGGAALGGALLAGGRGAGIAVTEVASHLADDPLAGARWLVLMGLTHWVAFEDERLRVSRG